MSSVILQARGQRRDGGRNSWNSVSEPTNAVLENQQPHILGQRHCCKTHILKYASKRAPVPDMTANAYCRILCKAKEHQRILLKKDFPIRATHLNLTASML